MRAAQAGCSASYVRLLTDISDAFRQVAGADLRRYGLQQSDGDDVLQDVLLAIHLKRHTWRPDHPFLPWLRAIARHKILDFVRRRSRRDETSIEPFAEVFAAPEPQPDNSIQVQRMLGELPRRQREVVEQLAVGGASVADAASKLKMSRGAVYVSFHRGLATLSALVAAQDML